MRYSYIIPVYKSEKYLDQCVESILVQTFSDFEILLVDDGSPDQCPVLCDEWSKKDNRIRAIHKKNGGASSARNLGIREAKGDYVIFLDSDDYWDDSHALERINQKLSKSNADIAIISYKKFYQNHNKYKIFETAHTLLSDSNAVRMSDLMRTNLFGACAWDKITRRQLLANNEIYFTEGQVGEDIEWCCKLLMFDFKYVTIVGDIYVYRLENSDSVTANISNKNLWDITHIIEKYAEIAKRNCRIEIAHFLSYQYLLLCALTCFATGSERSKIISKLGEYFYLLKYDLYPRVKSISKLRFLGYRIFRLFIVMYYKISR